MSAIKRGTTVFHRRAQLGSEVVGVTTLDGDMGTKVAYM